MHFLAKRSDINGHRFHENSRWAWRLNVTLALRDHSLISNLLGFDQSRREVFKERKSFGSFTLDHTWQCHKTLDCAYFALFDFCFNFKVLFRFLSFIIF